GWLAARRRERSVRHWLLHAKRFAFLCWSRQRVDQLRPLFCSNHVGHLSESFFSPRRANGSPEQHARHFNFTHDLGPARSAQLECEILLQRRAVPRALGTEVCFHHESDRALLRGLRGWNAAKSFLR